MAAGAVVAVRLGDTPAAGVVLQLADSKSGHPGREQSTLDRRLASALLRQADGLLFLITVQLLIRIFSLYNQAMRQNPNDKPFGVFIDINVPHQSNRPLYARDWINNLLQKIAQE